MLVTTGCATEPVAQRKEVSFDAAAVNPLIPSNYAAADSLLAQLRGQLAPAQALIAATVVNIDALEQSSTLGRLISEQVSARFTLAGYRMVEMKFRNNVSWRATRASSCSRARSATSPARTTPRRWW